MLSSTFKEKVTKIMQSKCKETDKIKLIINTRESVINFNPNKVDLFFGIFINTEKVWSCELEANFIEEGFNKIYKIFKIAINCIDFDLYKNIDEQLKSEEGE